ncbi:hypothetical protein [uncultured Sphingomonas sp.]|uniref:hypothetical protein n=1 Tax=uncultured Sphingomonas sp. TaxID=158754 RepID=UPI00260A5350|nr:hypothetical protein [uncultured Sphingomonas sp.]
MRKIARALGADIHDLGSTYASQGELCLLGLLALYQRSHPDLTCTIDERLRKAIQDCAICLSGEGLELGYSAAMRLTSVANEKLVRDVRPIPREKLRSAVESPVAMAPAQLGPSFVTALALVRKKGLATAHDLQRLGVPRQIIGQMHRKGLLRCLRTGVYYTTVDMRG